MDRSVSANTADVSLGLRSNAGQFTLLVIVNAFVGGMVGLERTILPQIAEREFEIAATSAVLSFIVVFGITKAITNYLTGNLANRFGRRKLLIAGWLFGVPVPFILMFAPDWNWIVGANVLLGINQGITWSTTVVMKIDLVGESDRGLAMGLNEFAGYISLALVAFLTGWVASVYGVRPYPFIIGIILVFAGLLISLLFVRDTHRHVAKEAESNGIPRLANIFRATTFRDPNLGSVTQAGLVNNLNDGMAWGLFPIFLAQKQLGIADIAMVTALYPAVWGFGQLVTGKMSDHLNKKWMLFAGMALQGIVLIAFVFAGSLTDLLFLSAFLGVGTAMVYPTFLSTIAENTHPRDRAQSLGVFRMWRDLGYAIGAVVTGLIADTFGAGASIIAVGVVTILSAMLLIARMRERVTFRESAAC